MCDFRRDMVVINAKVGITAWKVVRASGNGTWFNGFSAVGKKYVRCHTRYTPSKRNFIGWYVYATRKSAKLQYGHHVVRVKIRGVLVRGWGWGGYDGYRAEYIKRAPR